MKKIIRLIIHVQLIFFAHKAFGLATEDFATPSQMAALISQCEVAANPVSCYENGLRILMGDSDIEEEFEKALNGNGFAVHGTANKEGVFIFAETQSEFREKCLDSVARSLPIEVTSAQLFVNKELVFRRFDGEGVTSTRVTCFYLEEALLQMGMEDQNLPPLGLHIRLAFNRGRTDGIFKNLIVADSSQLNKQCHTHFNDQNFQDGQADYIVMEINGERLRAEYNEKKYWNSSSSCNIVGKKAAEYFVELESKL